MKIHVFDSSTEAYDAAQCNDNIEEGDVLVVPSEDIAGFLYRARPVAITQATGSFHTADPKMYDNEDAIYLRAREVAEGIVKHGHVYCQWFATCMNVATHTRSHPVLKDVAVCDRCDALVEECV